MMSSAAQGRACVLLPTPAYVITAAFPHRSVVVHGYKGGERSQATVLLDEFILLLIRILELLPPLLGSRSGCSALIFLLTPASFPEAAGHDLQSGKSFTQLRPAVPDHTCAEDAFEPRRFHVPCLGFLFLSTWIPSFLQSRAL